ncbi:MAG: hypothetical protein JNK67_17040 [Alphaproteobacteria bacterium]|nr:hypothetical protein [Alphaproteobacteria bacterium]
MMHVSTIRFRPAAEAGGTPGAAQQGPTQNGVPQGQCAFDVALGIAGAFAGNAGAIAGVAAGIGFGASPAGVIGGAVGAAVATTQAAVSAFNESQACQDLDNAGLANSLGLGAVLAP